MLPFEPPENIRKPLVCWCFQGEQKGIVGRKGLNTGWGKFQKILKNWSPFWKVVDATITIAIVMRRA